MDHDPVPKGKGRENAVIFLVLMQVVEKQPRNRSGYRTPKPKMDTASSSSVPLRRELSGSLGDYNID